jgi:hypothetical protein
MADYGIKISKPGYSIPTADLKDQILNSSANSLKIWMTGSVNISAVQYSTVVVDVAHNLGYAPFFLVYFKIKDANKLWMQGSYDETRLPLNYSHGEAKADSTNLKIDFTTDESNFTVTAYYIIFIDKAYE